MKHHALPRRIAVLLGLLGLLAFGCTVNAAADTADRIQWNSCDSGGITLEASCTQNARIVFDQQVEGTGAFGFDSLSTNNNVDRTYAQYFFYFYPDALDNARPTIDISNCAYVTFDLYLSKSLVSGNIVDTNFNVSNQTDSWDNGGRLCDASVLKNMSWQQGWNHVVIPIDWSKTASTFNRTALRRGRYYMLYRGSFSDMTFMIDDVCFITAAGLEDDTRRTQAKQLNVTIRELPAPNQITYAHAAKLRAANMAYDALPEAYRPLVFEHPALVRANKAFDAVAAARVDDMIAALPNPVSVADQTAVTVARDAYDDLTDAQRQLVTGLSTLVNAEQRLAALQDGTPIQVDFAVQTLRAEAGQTVALNFTLAQANSGIGAMGWQFDYDNRYLRPIAGPDGTVITAGSAVQNAVFAANDERLLVQLATADGLSASGTLLTLYFQVVQTPPANTTAAVTATLLNGPLHAADPVLGPVCHVYQVQVQSGGVAGPDTTQADKAAAKAVDDMILALPANITLQDEAAVTAARSAYDGLTTAQKGYVTDLAKLEAAEQALAALQAQPEPLPGDVNEDGVVDARDALLALKAAVGKESLSARQVKLADLNTDGAVDARDALLILKIAVGKPI